MVAGNKKGHTAVRDTKLFFGKTETFFCLFVTVQTYIWTC